MVSRSPSRGRSRSRSHTPTSAPPAERSRSRSHSRAPTHSRSPRRSISPRSRSNSRSRSPTPVPREGRNGHRSIARSVTRSRSPSRGPGNRSYRDRSHSRSLSRQSRGPQSSKIVVEKLTKNVTEAHLREIFGSYGQIETLDLPINRQCMHYASGGRLCEKLIVSSYDEPRYSLHPLCPSFSLRVRYRPHA